MDDIMYIIRILTTLIMGNAPAVIHPLMTNARDPVSHAPGARPVVCGAFVRGVGLQV